MVDLYRGYSEGLLADEEPTRFADMYGTAATGLLFAPSAGISDIMGLAPDPARQGEYLPSFGANIREGNYLDAGLQALGGAGDVMMAGGALFPPAAAAGALMKAPRAIRVANRTDVSDLFGSGAESVTYSDPVSGGFIEVLQRKDGVPSVLQLEVPEQFRGSGIGQELQAAAMADNPTLQGQVSSKAAAVGAYRLGRRPVGNPSATLQDVFDIIDEQSSVNMAAPLAPAGAAMKAPRVSQVGRLISQNIDRNPKKLAKEFRSQGLLGDITPEEFYSEFEKISDLKRKRSDARSGGDPLLTSAQYRPFRAKKMSLKKQIKESPMFNSWTKANRDRVLGSTDRQTANKEGSLATIEAIAREARKRGLKVYHTSKGKSGRASSRYIEMPDGNRVRISDHALPDTLEREHKRSVGVGIMSKDVVVDDWRNMSIDDYMSEILTPTGGRSDQQGEGIL